MWKFHSRHKSKASVPVVENSNTTAPSSSTPKSPTRSPTQTSTSTFEALYTELERSHLIPHSKSSPSGIRNRSRSRSADRSADPLGLSVVYEPETNPSIDIIFVHGLGGTSRASWCYDRDPEFFWPQKWLPSEPDIQTARILSFGYNARFTAPGPAPITGISDFAKDLLFGMKFAKNERLEELGIGERPIIFIAHSMGGLVVKKAYILGQNSGDYEEIVSSIKAIMFLATPHRGTHLAELLNRILSVSIFNHSPKQYVAELSNTSQALEDLNEQFRFVAPKLRIISFYETLPTRVGPKKITVLEKSSSILGYPTETSKSLNADHNYVCKYKSTQDPNYVSVRSALKTMVSTLRVEGQQLLGKQGKEQLKQLERLFAIAESPSEDLTFFQKRWTPGTCEWILSDPEYLRWVDGDKGAKALWFHALPATGKSVLSSFIINNLLEKKAICAYYFFRFDLAKRSLSACLQSLAFQAAEQLPSFRKILYDMSNAGVGFEKADARIIWQKIFTSILFKMKCSHTFYWVIDGLDETDSPRLLVELIQSISSPMLPIKVMLVSRRSPELISAFERLAAVGPLQSLTIEDNEQDIRRHVEQEIGFTHARPRLNGQIVQKLLERANGNFLWVNLALAELLRCHTPADVEETLEGLPSGMEELYHQMELSISKSTRPRDQDLARAILIWATCPRRPLILPELEQALKPEFPVLLDLSFTISQVCGQFVVIDSAKQIVMVHQTAREYLIKSTKSLLAVPPAEAHQKMFAKCIYFLEDSTQRRRSERRKSSHLADVNETFLRYAATSWPYHLDLASATSNEHLTMITKFLDSMPVLAWISSLAEFGQLKVLVHASKTLNTFVRRRRKYDAGTNPLLHRLKDLELIELWATDLIKVVGKFGPNLIADPSCIYKKIPPFCPRDSMIHKQFGTNVPGLSVNGISSTSWDDSLAKISLGSGSQAIMMVCSGNHFAVLTTSGQVVLYSTITFEAVHVLHHGERVCAISFSHGCDRFVSCALRTTKVWSIGTGKVIFKIQNPATTRALKITFSANDNALLIGSADRSIRIALLNVPEPAWSFIDQGLLREDNSLSGAVTNSPCSISFSPDATHVAVAYRGFPLSVWSIDPPELISRCRRNPNDSNNLWAPVDRVAWHPYSGEVLGIYLGGYVFKWHPYKGTHYEVYASASIIACSPEGTLFATSDGSGTIKLYDFDHFTLVYQLYCENLVNDVCFSPDSRRLYDLRGQFCSVWEPNALLRLGDVEEGQESEVGSELGSLPTAAISEAVAQIRDMITAISNQPRGSYHAVADESGIISIFSSSKAIPPVELFRSASMLRVEHLDWGEDRRHLACAELGGKITVKLVTPPGPDENWAAESIFDIKMEVEVGGIQQIILNNDSKIILIANRRTATILSLNTKFNAVSRPLPAQCLAARWIKHPTDPTLLLVFTLESVGVYRWHDLMQIAVLEIRDAGMKKTRTEDRLPLVRAGHSDDSIADDDKQNVKINRLIATPTGSHILFQYTITTRGEGRSHQTLIFDTLAFEASNFIPSSPDIATSIIRPILIPEEIETRIEIPLGILPKNRFIYLDKEFSMCSLRLNMKGVDVNSKQEHFFLPRDWLNSDCLELCTLLPDGTFLIPHNGEIAVIKSSVMLEW